MREHIHTCILTHAHTNMHSVRYSHIDVYLSSELFFVQVFAGFYPMDQSEYSVLRSALEKLTLNDSSVSVFQDSSVALGQGWRLGFLGLLHMDVFRQRLEEVCVRGRFVCVCFVVYGVHAPVSVHEYVRKFFLLRGGTLS